MPIDNILILDKYKKFSCLEIYSDDERIDKGLICLINALYNYADGKNLFVDIYGSIEEEDRKYVIEEKKLKQKYWFSFWMRRDWLISSRSIFEEDVNICFFDDCYEWEDYLRSNVDNYSYISKESRLCLIASFGEAQPPTLYFRNDNPIRDLLIDSFVNNGYRLKKNSHWF